MPKLNFQILPRKSLFWRLSLVFLLVLLFVGLVYSVIGAYTAQQYYEETNQRLNAGVAKQILKSTQPFDEQGRVNDTAVKQLFERVMFLNPSIEIYLLDQQGSIQSYFAPDRDVAAKKVAVEPIKRVKQLFERVMFLNPSIEIYLLDQQGSIQSYFAPDRDVAAKKVAVEPIKRFIAKDDRNLIRGTDPKAPEQKQAFSAAPIKQGGELQGYLYVILASKDYQSITDLILSSYILKGGGVVLLVTLGFAMLIGVGLIGLITRYTRRIIAQVNQFKAGDYQARIPVKSQDELGQLAKAFNDMADTLEANVSKFQEMEQARRDLVANVSHDLRTPLANLTGYVETLSLKGRHLSIPQKDRYLNIILQNTTRLKKLIDELFELSRLESRQIEPRKEPFFINELVQDIAYKYQLREDLQNVSIAPVIQNDLPPVCADVSMIDRVIQNLLDNAVKYTPDEGRITIQLDRCQQAVAVTVADTGPGIPPAEQELIFHRYRKPDHPTYKAKGSGLGLAIVKNMLEIQGFAIHVDSEAGAGTAFYFYLPFYDPSPEPADQPA